MINQVARYKSVNELMTKKHEIIRGSVLRIIEAYAILLLVFLLVIRSSYYISGEKIINNYTKSVHTIQAEGIYPKVYGNCFGFYDNYSDALLLNIIINQSKERDSGKLSLAVANYYTTYEEDPIEVLEEALVAAPTENDSKYTRYWLGVVPIIKFFLLFFGLADIRHIIQLVYIFLNIIVTYMQVSRLGWKYTVPYMLVMGVFGVSYNVNCLSFCTDIIVMQIVLILILWRKSFLYRKNRFIFYFVTGAFTFFLNFLSVPIYTLGIPLLYELMFDKNNGKVVAIRFKSMVSACTAWFSGYVIFVLTKMILSYFMFGDYSGITHLKQWSGVGGGTIGDKVYMVMMNFFRFFEPVPVFVMICIICLYMFSVKKYHINKEFKLVDYADFIGIMFVPPIWLFIWSSHAGHAFDVFYWGVSLIGLLFLMSDSINFPKGSVRDDKL